MVAKLKYIIENKAQRENHFHNNKTDVDASYLVMVRRIWLVPTTTLPMCATITVTTSKTQNSMPSTKPLKAV